MSHGTAPLQQSILAYLRTIPAGEWVTLEDVIFAVRDQPTWAGKSSVRRTVTDLASAGLVEHETGSHELRLSPSAPALTCEVCGGPIQATNKARLCRKTVECCRERDRRRSGTKPGVPKTLHNYRRKMLYSARHRARKDGIPFDMTMDDIPEIPERCPLLGIPLVIWQAREEHRENTPSLDKIDPSLGYVKGNLWIISTRANQIKNDATPEELMKVALGVRDEVARRSRGEAAGDGQGRSPAARRATYS
jgi:hypothetical protein